MPQSQTAEAPPWKRSVIYYLGPKSILRGHNSRPQTLKTANILITVINFVRTIYLHYAVMFEWFENC